MSIACWSVKGGVGTSVVAALLAHQAASTKSSGTLLVDLDGDAPGVLGVPEPSSPGVAEWLSAYGEVRIDALRLLEKEVAEGFSILPRGSGPLRYPERAEVMAREFSSEHRETVIDCGCLWRSGGDPQELGGEKPPLDDIDVKRAVVAQASRSWLVTRSCFLALRRAARAPLQPSGVVLLVEPGRALTPGDVEDVVGAPLVLRVEVDPAVARAVDAGILAGRLPGGLVKAVAKAWMS